MQLTGLTVPLERIKNMLALELRRIIVFAADLKSLGAFYRDVLGLTPKPTPDNPHTWLEFHAGACSIALRNGGSSDLTGRPPKIVFHAADVKATRDALNARGANFGRIIKTELFEFCNSTDPKGTR